MERCGKCYWGYVSGSRAICNKTSPDFKEEDYLENMLLLGGEKCKYFEDRKGEIND